jgi:uroporphyrinogen decarboxylase
LSRFLKACRRQPVDVTPIWFMRQAGRYMAEYRALREEHSLLEICRTPDLAAEVTLQPVRRIEVDAAILFSDLLLPLEPMGLPFDFVKGEGPQIERPIESAADIERLKLFEPREALGHVLEAIEIVQEELHGRVPLIGFAGAPFTLASYAIEGGHSNNFARTKSLMYGVPALWHELMRRLSAIVATYLRAQIEAGADAVQLFDSWPARTGIRPATSPSARSVSTATAGFRSATSPGPSRGWSR